MTFKKFALGSGRKKSTHRPEHFPALASPNRKKVLRLVKGKAHNGLTYPLVLHDFEGNAEEGGHDNTQCKNA